VDFRDRGESFEDADRRFAELARQRDAGSISEEQFEAQRQQLMVRDADGNWWAKLGQSGEWYRREGGDWERANPPGHPEADLAQYPSPATYAQSEVGRKPGRRRLALWLPLLVLALVAIGIGGWVLVPYAQGKGLPDVGELIAFGQGGSSQDGSGQSNSAQGGAFQAVFVHRATPNNISTNSTYIDNPLTNGNPHAVLMVTQNWNPGGNVGTYNNHSIGVWYDASRKKWAIFNQDRKPMTEKAAFNVAVQ
jgi:hypothetical protein